MWAVAEALFVGHARARLGVVVQRSVGVVGGKASAPLFLRRCSDYQRRCNWLQRVFHSMTGVSAVVDVVNKDVRFTSRAVNEPYLQSRGPAAARIGFYRHDFKEDLVLA
jgi:hypothetical protein